VSTWFVAVGGETVTIAGGPGVTVTVVLPELPACLASPPYVAVIVWVAAFVDVKVAEQLDCGAVRLGTRTQSPNGTALPSAVKLTLPSGALFATESVSTTVAVHKVEPPAWNEAGEQLTLVEVERFVTVIEVVPSLGRWVVSPP
jgi:hypothetical protein